MANGNDNGNETGGQGVLNAQIYSDSTAKYPFEPNPVGNFVFSGREDVVTVKDIEEIVKTIRDCFENFINIQRSYLDRQSQTITNDGSSSSDTTDGADSSTSTNQSNSSGLTEQADFDIIKKEISKDISSSKDEILKNFSDIYTDISSKIENNTVNISEKLIESSNENINDEYINSFIEYMSSTIDDVKNEITDIASSKEPLEQSALINGSVEVVETPLKDNSTLESGNDVNVEEIEEIDGEKLIYQISENINEQLDEQMDNNKKSLFDKIGEEMAAIGNSFTDLGNRILNSLTVGLENLTKNATDMFIQDSSIQMMANGTVEGITEPVLSNVNSITNHGVETSSASVVENNFSNSSNEEDNGLPSSNITVEDMHMAENTASTGETVTENVEGGTMLDGLTSFLAGFKDTIKGMFDNVSDEKASEVVNGASAPSSLTEMLGEQSVASPNMVSNQQSSSIAESSMETVPSQSTNDTQTSMEALMDGIKENREYNGNRFDKLESMLEKKLNEPPVHTETMTIPDNRQIFEVERIH